MHTDKDNRKKSGLSPEACERILRNISGLIIVDPNGRLVFLSPDMEKRLQSMGLLQEGEEYRDRLLEQLHPLTKLKTGTPPGQEGEYQFYMVRGIPNISKVKPIMAGDQIDGFMDYDIAFGTDEVKRLLHQLDLFLTDKKMDLAAYVSQIHQEKLQGSRTYEITDLVGSGRAMTELKQEILRYSVVDGTVLITGETGTGKELVAQSIHNLSRRGSRRMVCVNCASIPDNLLESELFGFDEGTFSGAKKGGNMGKFEEADGSTIFLDEIDQLQYHLQPKLLRVLQEKEINRIGGKVIPINVRIIAATNKDLAELVEKNQFREDLYYRLNILNLNVPSLRSRKEDIPELTDSFIASFCEKGRAPTVEKDVYDLLKNCDWPGNVRELYNMLERALTKRSHTDRLTVDDFQSDFSGIRPRSISGGAENLNLSARKEALERHLIEKALEECGNNKKAAAEKLGITRASLYKKMEKYKLKQG